MAHALSWQSEIAVMNITVVGAGGRSFVNLLDPSRL